MTQHSNARTIPPRPLIAGHIVWNGGPAPAFEIASDIGYPDALAHRRKLAVLVPATNTTMEHELWTLVRRNSGPGEALEGVGLHTVPVRTPRPVLATDDDLAAYRLQFLAGLDEALELSRAADPDHVILGMSLDHVISGLDAIRGATEPGIVASGLPWSTAHEALAAALSALGVRRIGLLTPYNAAGNSSSIAMFSDMGVEVVSSVGFACAHAQHIAHVPDWAKERAVLELLARPEHRLDAVVQCGTNLGFIGVVERLEPRLRIPLISVNAALLWHAARSSGIMGPLQGGGRLLRER